MPMMRVMFVRKLCHWLAVEGHREAAQAIDRDPALLGDFAGLMARSPLARRALPGCQAWTRCLAIWACKS